MPSAPNVTIVSTGTANLASIFAGLRRLNATAQLCENPDEILSAPHVILPGVGAFAAAMERLNSEGFVEPLKERIRKGLPTLTVCLGLHLLCRTSDESPGATGLGVLDLHVSRFPSDVRVPQFGWNKITAAEGCKILQSGYAYFANSYRLLEPIPGWNVGSAYHGGPFAAAIERGNVVGCQFHPELSGQWGQDLIQRWLDTSGESEGATC